MGGVSEKSITGEHTTILHAEHNMYHLTGGSREPFYLKKKNNSLLRKEQLKWAWFRVWLAKNNRKRAPTLRALNLSLLL